ncbi:hypothetical protein [Paraliomyxa miuraensis]|uniref:hypothetical protein n=1 Tax=Paraliomyxa miuraensis TaxID=376150 RepID=UPI0022530D96|nr:hypothetical protein [Paraliomyxa miuraensis]MCX4245971.1 hypothetical protein [Paraliomyxa miuraensis]
MRPRRAWVAFVAGAVLFTGLASGCDEESGDEPSESESDGELAPCDEQSVLTYDTFGRGFLATYCDGCHGAAVTDERRRGAPVEVVFDTREGAEAYADRILARTAPPDGSEATMPPVGGVTEDDRARLVVWLTCWE